MSEKLKTAWQFVARPSFAHGLGNWALLVTGFVLLSRGAYLSFSDVTASLGLLGAGAVLIFAGSIDRFETLKGLGLEAKTREISKKISDAEQSFEHLRQLAGTVYRSLIQQSASAGRWDSAPTCRQAHELATESRKQMRALGVEEAEIEAALQPWVKVMTWDWVLETIEPLRTAMHAFEMKVAEEVRNLQPMDAAGASDLQQATKARRARFDAAFTALFNGSAASMLSEFRAMVREFADLDPQFADGLLRAADDWESELSYLVSKQDLRTPSRWYDYLAR